MYDNTKLDAAVAAWIVAHNLAGYGESPAALLLEHFDQYCSRTGALKRSPGRVAFGAALVRAGHDKRRLGGATYWAGLILPEPDAAPKRRGRPPKAQPEPEPPESPDAQTIKARMAAENKARNLSAAELDG